MGNVRTGDDHRHIINAQTRAVFFAQTDLAGAPVKHFDDRGTDYTGQSFVPAGNICTDDTAVLIGSRAHRRIHQLARNEIFHHDTVAAGIDIRIAGLAVFIDNNSFLDL